MLLNNLDWFLLGALFMLFLYFITFYITKREEKYNLYFALGCLFSIIRIISYGLFDSLDASAQYYELNRKIDHLSFLWGPFLYILLQESLFPKVGHKIITKGLLLICTLISICIVFIPPGVFPYYWAYDYFIFGCMIYSTYIFTIALIKKKQYSISLFIANVVFTVGLAHDVLSGSNIISSSLGEIGEIFPFAYLFFLYIASVVSAKKYLMVDKKRLESQINFLHAQIQPHFLYNTINTIIAYCRTDPEQSRELLIELSTYLRGKFKSQKDMFTSLKDEIELIKSYLTIEQIRFEDRISVEYDIDEDCNILIPCLILQPIVENAVKHGLIPKEEGGTLSLSVKKAQNSVVVKIKDNGIGIDTARLSDIMEGGEGGIGLSNTNERLKQHYNTEIKVKSKKGKGSEFTVTIPINRG